MRELLGEAEFERHEIEWDDESVESYARFMLDSFGPLLNAREGLGEREDELDEAFRASSSSENRTTTGRSGSAASTCSRSCQLDRRALEDLDLLDRAARAEHDAGERVVGERDRHAGLGLEPLAEAAQQRAAAGEQDAVAGQVGRQLGRRVLERVLDRVEDLDRRAARAPRAARRS